jgi:hypothetical protein
MIHVARSTAFAGTLSRIPLWQVLCPSEGREPRRGLGAFPVINEEVDMKRVMAFVIGLWLPAVAWAANPSNTYTGTTVEHVDTGKQTLSIKTREGERWTLHVSDPEMLKKQNVQKGDTVSVQVDTNNEVIKIAKAGESGSSGGGMEPGSGQ